MAEARSTWQKVKSTVTNKYFVISLFVLMLISAALIYYFRPWRTASTKTNVDILQNENDSLLKANENLNDRNAVLNGTVDSLNGEIQSGSGRIKKVYINVEKLVYMWDTASVVRKRKFFTDRYGQ